MFGNRPFPQQQNPWELAPEVYVQRGRHLGMEDGHRQGVKEGYGQGWDDAIDEANKVIRRQQAEIEALQRQSEKDIHEFNQVCALEYAFQDTVQQLVERNPKAKAMILNKFKANYAKHVKDFLSQRSIKIPPHQDPEFQSTWKLTSRYLREILAS